MSFRTLTRPILFAASLLTGLGQSMDALGHGVAHAHEAAHREAVAQPESRAHQQEDPHRGHHEHDEQHRRDDQPKHDDGLELTPPDHQHGHVHAIVDAGLKSRSDLVPFLVAQPPALALSASVAVEHEIPHAGSPAPPPERRHSSASPRAPPSR